MMLHRARITRGRSVRPAQRRRRRCPRSGAAARALRGRRRCGAFGARSRQRPAGAGAAGSVERRATRATCWQFADAGGVVVVADPESPLVGDVVRRRGRGFDRRSPAPTRSTRATCRSDECDDRGAATPARPVRARRRDCWTPATTRRASVTATTAFAVGASDRSRRDRGSWVTTICSPTAACASPTTAGLATALLAPTDGTRR